MMPGSQAKKIDVKIKSNKHFFRANTQHTNEYIHLTVTNYKDNQYFIGHIMNGCQ